MAHSLCRLSLWLQWRQMPGCAWNRCTWHWQTLHTLRIFMHWMWSIKSVHAMHSRECNELSVLQFMQQNSDICIHLSEIEFYRFTSRSTWERATLVYVHRVKKCCKKGQCAMVWLFQYCISSIIYRSARGMNADRHRPIDNVCVSIYGLQKSVHRLTGIH